MTKIANPIHFDGPEAMQARVTEIDVGFSVTLHDLEAGEQVPTAYIYPFARFGSRARRLAIRRARQLVDFTDP